MNREYIYNQSEKCKKGVMEKSSQIYAEDLVRHFANIKFNKKFQMANVSNQKGYDVISEDGEIKIEVKSTSSLAAKSKILRINRVLGKKDLCTHIAAVEFYNKELMHPRISIIPHDEFFASNVSPGTDGLGIWNWDSEYGDIIHETAWGPRQKINTKLFLEYEIEVPSEKYYE